MMSLITTHVLDTALGKPAVGVSVKLEWQDGQGHWSCLAKGVTNQDGRVMDWLDSGVPRGVFQITFDTGEYFKKQNRQTFYPYATIVFEIENNQEHYHIPLLLSGYGYSTYRGS